MLVYRVFQPVGMLDEWRVESTGDRQVYVALFSGPAAKIRAEEYAAFKNRDHPYQSDSVTDTMMLKREHRERANAS